MKYEKPTDYPWAKEMPYLQKDFSIDDLKQQLEGSGIDGIVLVQSNESLAETDWLLQTAQNENLVKGVVGWFPVDGFRDIIARYKSNPRLVGARHIIQGQPAGFMDRENFNSALDNLAEFGLAYDLLVYQSQLAEANRLVTRHPQLTFVVDHLAKPAIDVHRIHGRFISSYWNEEMKKLSEAPNVYVKFSGGVLEKDPRKWKGEIVNYYFEMALRYFGSERIMYGSNAPLINDAMNCESGMKMWKEMAQKMVRLIHGIDLSKVMEGNARKAYNLKS